MFGWFYHRLLRRMERRYSYDATYLHEVVGTSPAAFRRFMIAQSAGRFRGTAPRDAWLAAMIGGAVHEDCGPCVQITTDMALEGGLAPETIASLLAGKPAAPTAQLGFDFARALLAQSSELDDLREEILQRFGKGALIALAMAPMYGRNFPVLKRAMGHAKACQKVRVGDAEVIVRQAA